MTGKLLLIALLLLAGIMPAFADGFMVPVRPEEPRFSVTYHRVNVTIDHQVATTDIDQAFHNNASREVEGTYIFPIEDGMTISKFTMYVNNEPLEHKIMDREEARWIYNGIVAKRQDPALLEWLGTRMIQARVYPIAANEDKRIKIGYQEVLQAQGGVIKYVYPLKTEKMSAKNLQECSVDITIRSAQPIRSVYSPTHNITVDREGDRIAKIHYSEKNVLPDQDLVLYYTVSEQDVGLDMLSYRDPDKGDGYFLALVAPKADLKENDIQPKDVVFVLDRTGSMAGDNKIEQAKAALKFCLNNLDKRDRFNVIAFNEEARRWETGLQTTSRDNIKSAEAFVVGFKADGGTDINEALKAALNQFANKPLDYVERPNIIIFLTDGLPTVGETNVETILVNVRKNNARQARVFDFGVGYDYNAHFLDKLANQNHGAAENVLPREDIEVKVSGFYKQVSAPLLMNVRADWGGAEVYDIYPKEMPDIFKDSQIVIAGRYKLHGDATRTEVKLTGDINGKKQIFTYPVKFTTSETDDAYIPRLWATRKIGYLEDQARLNGANKELMEEIIRLSKEFGILTEYTSFLVDTDLHTTDGRLLGSAGPAGPAGAAGPPMAVFANPGEAATYAAGNVNTMAKADHGASGVSQSINRKSSINAQQGASTNGNYIVNDAGDRVQLNQMRNISQRSFVQAGAQWVDVNYQQNMRVVKVKAFSPAYFQLANAHPRMAQFLSQNGNVTVALKNLAIQTGPDGQADEFKPAEFTDIKKNMDAELGPPTAAAPIAKPAARAPVADPLLAAWAIPVALPFLLLRRRLQRGKQG